MPRLAFLKKLFSFFYRDNDPLAVKKKAMKQLAKELSGNRHSRFYRPRSGLVEPGLGNFVYDIYRIIFHAHGFLNNAAKSALLKELIIEAFLDIKYLDARQRLTAEYVKERAKTTPIIEVSRLLQEDFDLLASGIDNELMGAVDLCYNQILSLVHFSAFDFFFFLKKFDPNLVEQHFNYRPHFYSVLGVHLSSQIKDLLEAVTFIDTELDWQTPLRILKVYKNGTDIIVPAEWDKLISMLRELRRSNILELMIRHIDENPSWQQKTKIGFEHIASDYLGARELEVREAMNGFVKDQKNLQIQALARDIFGDPDIRRALHYTPKESAVFVSRGLEGYTYAESFNYTRAFLLDIFKKDIHDLCELLLIRGQWYSVELSLEMSDSFHTLTDTVNQVIAFDDSLAENGETGSRLWTMLAKADRDKSQLRHIKTALKEVNSDAMILINTSIWASISIGKNIKNILEDQKSGGSEYINNWKQLELMVEHPLTQTMILAYKRIFGFLQVLQLISGDSSLSRALTDSVEPAPG
jgi:hypothetical protein